MTGATSPIKVSEANDVDVDIENTEIALPKAASSAASRTLN